MSTHEQPIVMPVRNAGAGASRMGLLRSSRCIHSFSPYPKKITAWPLRPGSLTTAPRHLPLTKSKTTTSS